MRSMTFTLLSSLILLGCHGKATVEQPELTSTLSHEVDFEYDPGMIEQYRIGVFSVGGWVNQKLGQRFQRVQPQHEQAAMVICIVQTQNGTDKKLLRRVYLSIKNAFQAC